MKIIAFDLYHMSIPLKTPFGRRGFPVILGHTTTSL
jgi:hypothetical protein